ncbi:MAG: metallophosphoesterase [Phycisphaeraceae bacterium]
MPANLGLVHSVDLSLPKLPAGLEGLRIAHLTDLHVARPHARHRRLISRLANHRIDLIVLTGDYMNRPGTESPALTVLKRLFDRVQPRVGAFGVFGNHETDQFQQEAQALPVRWLNNRAVRLNDLPLEIAGLHSDRAAQPDSIALLTHKAATVARAAGAQDSGVRGRDANADIRNLTPQITNHKPEVRGAKSAITNQNTHFLRLLLSHAHDVLPTAADLGFDLVFAGHTHGGQCRLPFGRAVINASDYPLRLSAGVMRHRNTLCVVSRGLGENAIPVRLFCPRQVPLCTLRRGPMPGQFTNAIENIQPW